MNKRIFAALGTVILGAGLIAGIGSYVAAAKNDPGHIEATSAGTYTSPDGKSYPHYTLNLNTYPNAPSPSLFNFSKSSNLSSSSKPF
jgi:hypothetical protein